MSAGPHGHVLRWSLWAGEEGGGALIDGCPPGIGLDEEAVGARLLSGLFEGRTTGTPIALVAGDRDRALLAAGAVAGKVIDGVAISTVIDGDDVRCVGEGVPVGWGAPVYARLDAELARAIGELDGVRRIEIGDGFAAARLTGAANADAMRAGPEFRANHAGGILGGISSGQPLLVRVGFDAPGEHSAALVAASVALVLADQKLLHRAQCG
ncbi:hypothetical protein GCM10023232_26570 [Sphingosinicella ginsenosidimutans]|uniref:chorismate synthase n=1 Tax=Allosphingosinicella ginsenosidimutans TaxID=1176539 RepID=A0A5C6TTX7_9SPHN|nr:chorismate synthase [Sphingosinicella ginsenosidimutans]TXC63726.1 chorismate synthase [Sphingosinicella ginsenosidimutans]